MARYAALCQEAGIVPIVEPEVLMDGDHSIQECEVATSRTLATLYEQLAGHRVDLAGSLLKVNMVVSGADAATQAGPAEVAEATLRVLLIACPLTSPASSSCRADSRISIPTVHLNEMNRSAPHPWPVSFSYGRALQAPSIKAWGGSPDNVQAGQRALAHRARMNGLAQTGDYSAEAESSAA